MSTKKYNFLINILNVKLRKHLLTQSKAFMLLSNIRNAMYAVKTTCAFNINLANFDLQTPPETSIQANYYIILIACVKFVNCEWNVSKC